VLSIPGIDEDAAATGDLDVTDHLSAIGAGAAVTIVEAAGIDRVFHIFGSASLRSVTVTGGQAPDVGGGILVERGGAFELRYGEIRENTAFFGGGGIGSFGATLTLIDSALLGNEAEVVGGGIHLGWPGLATLTNTTVTANSPHGIFTGAFSVPCRSARIRLINSTVTRNIGSGLYNTCIASAYTLTNTIVANQEEHPSIPGSGEDCVDRGYSGESVINSNGYNLDSDGTCFNVNADPTDLPNTDPLLGPLQDNGGPTWTHALLPGSPAIDAIPQADCTYDDDGDPGTPEVPVGTDQRGVPRPQGSACDIGAFEVNECADGANNDGDVFTDYPDDPGCYDAAWLTESPECQDGINNDPGQDALVDFDGGLSALGYDVSDPDPQCVGLAWKDKERTGCGIGGFELALILPGLMWLHRRRRLH
jgi:hypothetical protein